MSDMAKIIYHVGTGTYFGLDDDVVVIDTDEVAEPIDADLMEMEGDEIAVYWGKRITNIITEGN
jgi:predicted ThiF/HesA family dinucleotide-utilizing enzyme